MDVITRVRAELGRSAPETLAHADSRAAVAVVLRARAETPEVPGHIVVPRTEVLLIRRQRRDGDPWSGHMAFPGGRWDETDADLLRTAMRETREEVGIDLARGAQCLGQLRDVPAYARGKATGMVVSPFVFHLEEPAPCRIDPAEVEEALWASVTPLMRGERNTTYPYVAPAREGAPGGPAQALPAFDVEGRVVWGLTYMMLSLLFETIRTGEHRG